MSSLVKSSMKWKSSEKESSKKHSKQDENEDTSENRHEASGIGLAHSIRGCTVSTIIFLLLVIIWNINYCRLQGPLHKKNER